MSAFKIKPKEQLKIQIKRSDKIIHKAPLFMIGLNIICIMSLIILNLNIIKCIVRLF